MDRYTPLRWLQNALESASLRLDRYLDPIDERIAMERALKPGTKVRLNCSCPTCSGPENEWKRKVVWTVVRYSYDVDDYALECTRELLLGVTTSEVDYAMVHTLEVVECAR